MPQALKIEQESDVSRDGSPQQPVLAMPSRKKRYTYQDTLSWPESFRAELINGEIYVDGQPYEGEPPTEESVFGMAAPSTAHQRVLGELHYQLHGFLRNRTCEVFPAPFAVRLPAKKAEDEGKFFLPDIVVVCDPSKIDERGCNGVPDFIIEVLSPSTMTIDMFHKLTLYKDAGVREYWVADPMNKLVGVYILDGGSYRFTSFDAADTTELSVSVLGCPIDLKAVFA
jgi:Uma2 family endonuclease